MASSSSSGNTLMAFSGKMQGSTTYHSNDASETNAKFDAVYSNNWEIMDDDAQPNWSGSMSSGPSSWSVICYDNEKDCAIQQRSNIYATTKSSSDVNGKNFLQIDSRGTILKYKGTGSSSWMDYKFKFKHKTKDNDWIGVTFRQTDLDNYYQYEMGLQVSTRRLKKYVNGIMTVLAYTEPAETAGDMMNCKDATGTCVRA